MEQLFEWLSQPRNDGKPIDQKILSQLISASRERVDDDSPSPPRSLEVCRLLLKRLLKEAVTENALSTGLALCSALLLSSGASDVPDRVCGLLKGETLEKCPEWWFDSVVNPTGGEEELEVATGVPVSDVCVIGICHGTVNTALYKSFDRAQLSSLVEALLLLCRKPSRLTTTALRVLTSAIAQFRQLPEERVDFLAEALLPLVRFGWNGPANSPKEIRRLTETFLRGSSGCDRVAGEILALTWGSRAKLLALSALWSTCSREKVLECDAELPEKLAASLLDPPLVSAGTDAYLAFLGHVKDAEDWWVFFAGPLLPLLLSDGDWGATKALFTHWLPPTLKKFPGLYRKLLDAVPDDGDAQPCSMVLLHNEASKIMLVPVHLSPDNKDAVSRSLRHEKETVRLAGFSLLCQGFTPRQQQHEDAVASFLEENVTCDSEPLRQGIVGCVRTLMARIVKVSVSDDASPPTPFPLWLHAFLTENLTVGVGNYQRRLLSLMLFGFVLGLAEQSSAVFHRLAPGGQWNTKSEGNLNLLLCLVLWDPAKNIRQEAVRILTTHFSPPTDDPHLSCRLAVRGVGICRSGWFFRAEVAAEIFSLVSAWTGDDGVCYGCLEDVFGSELASDRKLVDTCSGMVKLQHRDSAGGKAEGVDNLEPSGDGAHVLGCPAKICASQMESLFSSLFYGTDKILEGGIGELSLSDCGCPKNCLAPEEETEFHKTTGKVSLVTLLLQEGGKQWPRLREDPVDAAVKGNPVHGVLSALTSVPVGLFSACQVRTVAAFVEELADWVLGVLASQSSGLSPSFADMGVALSSLADNVESDEQLLHLSPAFQTALNCLWLNLKACCEVTAHLVSSPGAEGDVAIRFLRVITSVLTQCRHKGAIEAAGRALSNFVKVVTSEERDRVSRTGVLLRDVPGKLLAAILDLMGNTETSVSVTRRSAGLAILVHRIVIGDSAYGHPILDMAVRRLLALAAEPVDPKQPSNVDSPQARAVHCLTAIVKEASLRAQVSAHVGEVTLLCLCRLVNSDNWNVRNAGLQLYAAAAPRLFGGHPHCSLEAMTWRHPSLAGYLLEHPGEVPALSLLAMLSCDADSAPSAAAPNQLLHRLSELYSESRPRQVRLLAAKAFAQGVALQSLPSVVDTLVAECVGDGWQHWNGLQGRLLCLEAVLARLAARGGEVPACVGGLRLPPHSPWPCREVYDRMVRQHLVRDANLLGKELLEALGHQGHFHQPGFFPWAEARARDVVRRCYDLLEVLSLLTGAGLDSRCHDVCLAALEELRIRPHLPPSLLLEALARGLPSPDLERGLLEALEQAPGGRLRYDDPKVEAAMERLSAGHPSALPPLARAALSSPRRPRLLRLLAVRVPHQEDDDASRRRHCASALASLLPSLSPGDGEVAEALLGAATALSEDDDEEVRRALGRLPPPKDVLGPRRAAVFLWRRLADVGGGVLEGRGRLSPFGQENGALREESCRVAALAAEELAAILVGEEQVTSLRVRLEEALDVTALEEAVASVVEAHGDKGTYLTLSAARLLSVKLGLLHDALSSMGGDQGLRDTLLGLRGKAEGCLLGLAP